MEREEVFELVKNCYNGEPATCIAACPFHLDVKSVLKKIYKGRLEAAQQEMHKTLPFPAMICEICPAPCEEYCQRSTVLHEETISIRMSAQACMQAKEKKERQSYKLPPLPQRAVVVGAGPVGLACALYLSRKRYPVVVFDKNKVWGGSICTHQRFPVYEAEFAKKFESLDVDFRFGEEITDLYQLDEFDVIFIATGKNGENFGLLDSCDTELGTTEIKNVFLGGELLGMSCVEGMAHASMAAKAIESYIQTGSAEHANIQWEKMDCKKNAPHHNVEPAPHIVPAGDVYSVEEAQAEAGRCMQCDCEECMKDCSLLAKYKKKPPRIAIDVAQDGMTRNSVSSACITRETWSCNLCGHCADVCGENVNIGDVFELSRKDRVKSGNYPPAFHGYWLKEMEQAVSESGLMRPAPGETGCDYVFFPGCRLGASNPDYVLASYDALLKQYKKTGVILDCCGIPALWAGEEGRFSEHVERLRKSWEELGKPVVIYACTSCRRTFARFLPEVSLISLYELLEKENMPSVGGTFSIFDSCSAYGMGEVREAVRKLADKAGCETTDYESNGKCCGFGGHIQLANPEFYDEVAMERIEESDFPYLVYCVNCREVFQSHGKASKHILDMVFGLEEKPLTSLEEKRNNNLQVKQTLMENYWAEKFDPEKEEWDDLQIEIPADVLVDMERALIPAGDVKKTIWLNEKNCEGYENEVGEVVCRMVGEYLTCWVRYKKENEIYYIQEVYSHRMHIREDEI
ncbi:pyridine nucleotide-disulfide oxidoreductase/dicluster-binding protein [Parasporobacterium paucivorans]|uniref:Fe-S oxidoreductase n=1 Tax=Parasporobacterium paucivorans DSM 15970 TaxID=1122934 RepID=A0A1M6HV47_9FIRM|nr:pyridine nucleotide-disulfide oxidoreductase/dicluster-binding protein [Parasporobacterium paucivorans]SHJ26079.1 Fe-S oxidoreductase [Parasporobacterium paucivorans DSM 15970]